jgi:hypothetical protein
MKIATIAPALCLTLLLICGITLSYGQEAPVHPIVGNWRINEELSEDTDEAVEAAIIKAGGKVSRSWFKKKEKGRYRGPRSRSCMTVSPTTISSVSITPSRSSGSAMPMVTSASSTPMVAVAPLGLAITMPMAAKTLRSRNGKGRLSLWRDARAMAGSLWKAIPSKRMAVVYVPNSSSNPPILARQ